MYLSHFNLKEKPFQINTDPKFLWLGEKHKEALATLKYGIIDNRGFLLLTGDVGTGKTTLINALLSSLGEDTLVATVLDPGLDKLDFFNFISNSFGLKTRFATKGEFLIGFSKFLYLAQSKDQKVLLVIDESQRLDQDLLEEIRLLSNIEQQDKKLLNIFFVGQDEFNDILSLNENRALRQRITINYNIDPLVEHEARRYIRHRIKVAGSDKEIFTSDAIREIISFSRGYPRLINIICDHALLTGYVKGLETINKDVIKECAYELKLKTQLRKKKIPYQSNAHRFRATQERLKPRKPLRWSLGLGILFLFFVFAFGYFFYPGGQGESLLTPKRNGEQAGSPPKDAGSGGVSQMAQVKKTALPGDSSQKTNGLKKSRSESTTPKLTKKAVQEKHEGSENDLPQLKETAEAFEKVVVHFQHNSTEIDPETYKKLDRLAAFVLQNPMTEIIIEGYSDAIGNTSYNIKVSQFRANIVKSYFVGKGCNPLKIKTVGMGPKNPIASNSTAKGRQLNRRVEITLNEKKAG